VDIIFLHAILKNGTYAYMIVSIEQDMHYAEFAEDEVSNFVRLTHP
jgi:hypothetical protein